MIISFNPKGNTYGQLYREWLFFKELSKILCNLNIHGNKDDAR